MPFDMYGDVILTASRSTDADIMLGELAGQRCCGPKHLALPVTNETSDTRAIAPSGCFLVMRLEAAALKPWINPSGHVRPQPDLYGQ
jgi:hypothetical protein